MWWAESGHSFSLVVAELDCRICTHRVIKQWNTSWPRSSVLGNLHADIWRCSHALYHHSFLLIILIYFNVPWRILRTPILTLCLSYRMAIIQPPPPPCVWTHDSGGFWWWREMPKCIKTQFTSHILRKLDTLSSRSLNVRVLYMYCIVLMLSLYHKHTETYTKQHVVKPKQNMHGLSQG